MALDKVTVKRAMAREKGHLMTGLSYMIPTITGSSLVIAVPTLIALACGVSDLGVYEKGAGLFHALFLIKSVGQFGISTLMNVVLAGFIAYSIGDKPAIGGGLIGGYAAVDNGSGFLGAVVAGYLAGHVVSWAVKHIHVPESIQTVETIIILPFLGTMSVALVMGWFLAPVLTGINIALVSWLQAMMESDTSRVLVAGILGAMIAFDMGGPVNKSAVSAVNALMANGIFTPKIFTKTAQSIPTFGYALATVLWKHKFPEDLKDSGIGCWVMGFIGITEGAIPFTLTKATRLIPLNVVAGAAGSMVAALCGCSTSIPPLSGVYGAILTVTFNPLGVLLGMLVGSLIIAVFAPLLVNFKADEETLITEDDVDIVFE